MNVGERKRDFGNDIAQKKKNIYIYIYKRLHIKGEKYDILHSQQWDGLHA